MKYEYWFASLQGISDPKKRMLREFAGTGEAIYYIEESLLKKQKYLTENDRKVIIFGQKNSQIGEEYEKFLEKNIKFIPCYDSAYPSKMKELRDHPYALFAKGNLPKEDQVSVAIVGARQCSPYGERQAIIFAELLAAAGVQIISGMARGIDGAAGRGAINVKGATYAILGSGVDVCYPRENRGLYLDIQKTGGILSEQLPGSLPLRENFPRRNRIISALSEIVLVMEAREKSGSLITADFALEQGKEVYALPGPVTSPLSCGCNTLIRQGAGILISAEDFAEEMKAMGYLRKNFTKKSDKNKKTLESTENILYSCLDLFPKGVHQLMEETGLEPFQVMETLVSLELKGYIQEISKNYYIRLE